MAAIASAVVLGISDLMTTFEFNAAGGDTLQVSDASDRHSYALLILAAFAIAMVVLHVRSGARPPALAAAAAGLIAVMVFLIGDLPDVNKVGDLSDPAAGLIVARADPQAGFWLELVGALGLLLSAGVMATLAQREGSRS
jgi:hypothetical protein